jgi:hypothetical protein
MQLLLAFAVSATLAGGAPHHHATDAPLRVTVTIGEPRVISVESADGWVAPGLDVVAPVPTAPARFEMTIPARSPSRRSAILDTI